MLSKTATELFMLVKELCHILATHLEEIFLLYKIFLLTAMKNE